MKRFLTSPLLLVAFSNYRWYRGLCGGKWMYTYVDYPVAQYMWLTVPDHATLDYREGLWRGTPKMEVW